MCRVAALFVTVVLAVASAAPDAGYVIPTPPTPPCNPKTEYITKYKEKVQQVRRESRVMDILYGVSLFMGFGIFYNIFF